MESFQLYSSNLFNEPDRVFLWMLSYFRLSGVRQLVQLATQQTHHLCSLCCKILKRKLTMERIYFWWNQMVLCVKKLYASLFRLIIDIDVGIFIRCDIWDWYNTWDRYNIWDWYTIVANWKMKSFTIRKTNFAIALTFYLFF